MALATTTHSLLYAPDSIPGNEEIHWYAAQTRANHEKTVAEQFSERCVEHFLPLYESARRWKDRRVTLQLPFFPGYILVRVPLRERLRILQVPGVSRLVGFNGSPVPLEDAEIDALREKLSRKVNAQPHAYLQIGRRVRVRSGPLEGFEGILVRKQQKYRIVVSIDLIMRSIAAEVDIRDVVTAN
jgi:transcription antitermination factor NusG